jgi:DNA-binding CsgD family transcriptional regulator
MMRSRSDEGASLGSRWPFVGRESELAGIDRARAEGCSGVVVTAGAGTGKSRLGREAIAKAAASGAMTEWVQATRSAAQVPLGACAGLLPKEIPSDQAFRLLQTTAQELHERAEGRRIVIGVDDAQWLDPVSATLVLQLATGGDAFILATVRDGEPVPDAIVSLWKDVGARRVELDGLGDKEIRGMIEAALEGPVEEEVTRWILDRSAGNPMFARELVHEALSAGSLTWERGLWRGSGPLSIADSLIEFVFRRIDALPTERQAPLQLLAIAEPLLVDEIADLTSYEALAAAEAEELITIEPKTGEVRLGHPLYGDALRASLAALRARGLRMQLAVKLQERERLTPEETLRVVRMLLDARMPVPTPLLIKGADAANMARDPALAGDLAEMALANGAGLPAALALARAQGARGLYREEEETLAAVEAEAAGDPLALEYLEARTRALFWGLGDVEATKRLVDRARAWSDNPAWRQLLSLSMPSAAAVDDLSGAIRDGRNALDDPALDEATRRRLEPRYAMALYYSGAWDEAQSVARRCHITIPVRTFPDLVGLVVVRIAGIESGAAWQQLEPELSEMLVEGVRRHDHEPAAHGALGLAQLAFMRGRFRDAERWLTEAELHLEREDVWGTIAEALGLRVAIACFTGEVDRAIDTFERLQAVDDHGRPRPLSRAATRARAQAWAGWARDGAGAAPGFLVAAESFTQSMPGLAALLAYDALLAGARARQVSDVLDGVAPRCDATLIDVYAAHASALVAADGEELLRVADRFEQIGATRYAMTAAVHAAEACVAAGRQDSARRAGARARELHEPDQGTEPPAIDGIEGVTSGITARERQIVELVRRGLTNAELAAQLGVSVRTVETHLYRAMQKLDVSDRRDL